MRKVHLLPWATVLFCNTLLLPNTIAGALDNWHIRNSSSNGFRDLIFANDLFVAIRYDEPIMTSPDGATWTPRPSGVARQPTAIAYGNGRFVLLAAGGTTLTSTNGFDWMPGTSGARFTLLDLTFGNGLFVAAGYAPLLTSADGLNWIPRETHGVSQATHVTFGNGKFLVHGAPPIYSTSTTNLLSSDGVNWTPVPAPYGNIYCVGFGKGTWVVVEIGNNLWTSRDATNWTYRGRLEIMRPQIHYAYGTWLMVGNKILSSSDGIAWTERSSNSETPLAALTAGRHTFVVAGYGRIFQSDPVVNLELRRENSRQLILSAPLDRAARIEFSETGVGEWQSLGTVTADSDPYIVPIDSRSATGFYRAVLVQQ